MDKNVPKMAEDGFERTARDKSAKNRRFKICRQQATPKTYDKN